MLKHLSTEIGRLLKKKNKTLAVAESCTGGLVSSCITTVPGSSGYFLGGVVAYSNRIKTSQLGVPLSVLNRYGAVSPETAEALARGARKKLKSDYGLAITGIAGPSGGSQKKPVGLVYIALTYGHEAEVKKFIFSGNREKIRGLAAQNSLILLQKSLLSNPRS